MPRNENKNAERRQGYLQKQLDRTKRELQKADKDKMVAQRNERKSQFIAEDLKSENKKFKEENKYLLKKVARMEANVDDYRQIRAEWKDLKAENSRLKRANDDYAAELQKAEKKIRIASSTNKDIQKELSDLKQRTWDEEKSDNYKILATAMNTVKGTVMKFQNDLNANFLFMKNYIHSGEEVFKNAEKNGDKWLIEIAEKKSKPEKQVEPVSEEDSFYKMPPLDERLKSPPKNGEPKMDES